MSLPYETHASTPATDLEFQIVSSTVPKNEREWWAHHEIERLRDELAKWRDAVIDKAVIGWTYRKEFDSDPELAINSIIANEIEIALDPAVSSAAAALRDTYKAELADLRHDLERHIEIASQAHTELAEARKDAERYRWLIGQRWLSVHVKDATFPFSWKLDEYGSQRGQLDYFIDSALEQEQKP